VEVEAEVAGLEEVPVDAVGDAFRRGPLRVARERAVQVAVVDGEVALLGDEPRDVENGETDQRPREVGMVPLVSHLPDHLDAVQFVAVRGRGEEHRGAGSLAVDDGDGQPDRFAEVGLADAVPDVLGLAGVDAPAVVGERFGFALGPREGSKPLVVRGGVVAHGHTGDTQLQKPPTHGRGDGAGARNVLSNPCCPAQPPRRFLLALRVRPAVPSPSRPGPARTTRPHQP